MLCESMFKLCRGPLGLFSPLFFSLHYPTPNKTLRLKEPCFDYFNKRSLLS